MFFQNSPKLLLQEKQQGEVEQISSQLKFVVLFFPLFFKAPQFPCC